MNNCFAIGVFLVMIENLYSVGLPLTAAHIRVNGNNVASIEKEVNAPSLKAALLKGDASTVKSIYVKCIDENDEGLLIPPLRHTTAVSMSVEMRSGTPRDEIVAAVGKYVRLRLNGCSIPLATKLAEQDGRIIWHGFRLKAEAIKALNHVPSWLAVLGLMPPENSYDRMAKLHDGELTRILFLKDDSVVACWSLDSRNLSGDPLFSAIFAKALEDFPEFQHGEIADQDSAACRFAKLLNDEWGLVWYNPRQVPPIGAQ